MRRFTGSLLVLCVALVLVATASAGQRENGPPPGMQAAIDACKAKGLQYPSEAFKQCVMQQLGSGEGTHPTPMPAQQAALDACKAKGLQYPSEAFKQCVTQQLQTGRP